MISRRLTKTQKAEILEAYRAGENSNFLAKKYSCTATTINRTVKTLLSENEYTLLKKKRSKVNNKKEKSVYKENVEKNQEDLEQSSLLISFKEKVKQECIGLNTSDEFQTSEVDKSPSLVFDDTEDLSSGTQDSDSKFEEIAPLISSFDFDLEKQKEDFEILNYESLPESVYMIVDKKVELDLQPISDLPEWSFLPENELQRNAILLFANQRSAKRICSRNQRVIKIPNTSVFKLSKSYLISKGITRLILEDLIIGLDD